MNKSLTNLEEAKQYRQELAKKLNQQRLFTSNIITKLLVKKSPQEILEGKKNNPEYIESELIVREDQKNYREEKQEKEKIERITNRIIESKSGELKKLPPEETQKIKEHLNNPDNKSNFIDKYIAFNLKKKEREEEERLKNTRRYNSGHDFHDRIEPSLISSTLFGLLWCGYIYTNKDTAKLLLDKGYGKDLIERFGSFDKEGQEYLVEYYLENRKDWYPEVYNRFRTNAVKLNILNSIYKRNAEYGHNPNYKETLKEILSNAVSKVVADEIKGMVDEWVARKGEETGRKSGSIRPDIRNLKYEIYNEDYKGLGFLKIGHLIEGEKVIKYLEGNGVFENIATISNYEGREVKRQIVSSFD